MEPLSELLDEIEPVEEYLTEIWEQLPAETIVEEQKRLRERFLDIGSKLTGISQIRGVE